MCGLFLDLSFYSDSEFSALYFDGTQDIYPVSSLCPLSPCPLQMKGVVLKVCFAYVVFPLFLEQEPKARWGFL